MSPEHTVYHVTHAKAGSQWVLAILERCGGDRVVRPRVGIAHVMADDQVAGAIYPTVYLTREELEAVPTPAGSKVFVVIRDLRDTLVSLYFSQRYSHPTEGFPRVAKRRAEIEHLSIRDGMLDTMRSLHRQAKIQRSWAGTSLPLIRYEDLLEDDVGVLTRVLLGEGILDVREGRLRKAIEECRFERLSGGRSVGTEDVNSHFRMGVTGDWRRYFDDEMRAEFKRLWGEELIATGYEDSDDW